MKKIVFGMFLLVALSQMVHADSWFEKMKFKGDFRYRDQNEWFQYDDTSMGNDFIDNYRERQRLRLRFGFEMPVNDKIKMNVRLATSGSMRSANQTMGDTPQAPFAQRAIVIDQMNLAYQPWSDELTLLVGKYSAPFWQISELAWSSSIAFEGIAAQYKTKLTDTVSVFVNLGQSQLAEINRDDYDAPDPFLNWWQPGVRWDLTPELTMTGAIANWNFLYIEDNARYMTNSRWNTTTNATAQLEHGFNVSNPQLMATYRLDPAFAVSVFQDTIINAGTDKGGYGDLKGITIGSPKVATANDWQLTYSYRRLGSDAFPDIFPEADAYFGYTDIEGQKWSGSYGIAENVVFTMSSFTMDRIDRAFHNPQNVLQYDLNVKF